MTAPAATLGPEAIETTEEGPRLLKSITLRNILSFGPQTPPLELRSLNLLIGPNGSGKSNLIEAIDLLRWPAPAARIEQDGVASWIWKGAPDAEASVEADGCRLAFRNEGGRCRIVETIPPPGEVRIYRDWAFGVRTAFRSPQRIDQEAGPLAEDFSNLFSVLERLRSQENFIKRLRDLYDGLDDFAITTERGLARLEFKEDLGYTIPLSRLSDGSLRYLCLLAILCEPDPPPLVCIEEPELGLHFDLMRKLLNLMLDFSERSQLIVTTHSELLADGFTDYPEAVVVVEKRNNDPTSMKRLAGRKWKRWLEEYRLGSLWTSGQLGGVRW